jgi:hypothetical protein
MSWPVLALSIALVVLLPACHHGATDERVQRCKDLRSMAEHDLGVAEEGHRRALTAGRPDLSALALTGLVHATTTLDVATQLCFTADGPGIWNPGHALHWVPRSDDGEKRWTETRKAFDAVIAGWDRSEIGGVWKGDPRPRDRQGFGP